MEILVVVFLLGVLYLFFVVRKVGKFNKQCSLPFGIWARLYSEANTPPERLGMARAFFNASVELAKKGRMFSPQHANDLLNEARKADVVGMVNELLSADLNAVKEVVGDREVYELEAAFVGSLCFASRIMGSGSPKENVVSFLKRLRLQ